MKSDLKFTLTKEMAQELLNYNEVKKEYIKKMIDYEDNSNENIKQELIKLEEYLDNSRKRFIELFKKNNKEEIQKYLMYNTEDEK